MTHMRAVKDVPARVAGRPRGLRCECRHIEPLTDTGMGQFSGCDAIGAIPGGAGIDFGNRIEDRERKSR